MQLVVVNGLFPLFQSFTDTESAWRTVLIIPCAIGVALAACIALFSDDSPKGNLSVLRKHHAFQDLTISQIIGQAVRNLNTWMLFLQIACSTGASLTVQTVARNHLRDEFGFSSEAREAYTTYAIWVAIGSVPLGGFVSDRLFARAGMKGRLRVHATFIFLQGVVGLVSLNVPSSGAAIFLISLYTVLGQLAYGSTYSIVPMVDSCATGTVASIVELGNVIGSFVFASSVDRFSPSQRYNKTVMMVVAGLVMASSLLSVAMDYCTPPSAVQDRVHERPRHFSAGGAPESPQHHARSSDEASSIEC